MGKSLYLLQDGQSDSSYFSADCLSISQKGHGKLAYALWNNMVKIVGYPWNAGLEHWTMWKAQCSKVLDTSKVEQREESPFVEAQRLKLWGNLGYQNPLVWIPESSSLCKQMLGKGSLVP